MTELSSVYGVINSNKINAKNLINDGINTNAIQSDIIHNVLNKYYKSIKLVYREQFLQEKHKDKDNENYIEYDTNYNETYWELSTNVVYFDWILELLSVIEPHKKNTDLIKELIKLIGGDTDTIEYNYKPKHTKYTETCMMFKNNSRIVRIEYEKIN